MFCIYQQENTGVGTFLQIKPLAEVLRFYSKETPAHTKDVFRTANLYNKMVGWCTGIHEKRHNL